MTDITIARIERLELAFAPRAWPFAVERRAEIDRYFEAEKQAKPALFNGSILLLYEHAIAGELFRGAYLDTDFASYLAWRAWGHPDPSVKNCFGMGALRGSDGAFLLGVMAAHTANAQTIYFPAGMLDPTDVVGETVDLAGNVRREVLEETGLRADDFETQPGWHSVLAGPRIAMIKILQARESAAALRGRILAHLAQEQEPELADIRIVRSPAEFDPMMPPFVTAFMSDVWSRDPS
jgi:8-oxo-dGTP pyrophosphatase MutT (NUDIX family)